VTSNSADRIALVPVQPSEYDDFFAMFEVYHRELDPYDPSPWEDPHGVEEYRHATLTDMEGRELLWITSDGARAGFCVVRTNPDWPDASRDVAEIAEFYVVPECRRAGVGRAAVEALMAEHRRRGTHLVEAGILVRNEPARAFWASVGFEVVSLWTARKP
jgi:ribosomal protein S18 acetylase RimI-like enzyme